MVLPPPPRTAVLLVVLVVALLLVPSLSTDRGAGNVARGIPRAELGSFGGMASSPAATGSSGAAPTLRPTTASVPTWLNVTRSSANDSVPASYGASVAYDPSEGATVLFGGCLLTTCPSNQTWLFAGGVWTDVTRTTDTPPARDSASLDYDATMGGLLLFGGLGVTGAPLNDTWLYAGGRWTNLSYLGGAPSPREGAMMAFDPAPEENGSVLYGGCIPVTLGVSCFNDTWVWQGWAGWIPLTPSELPPTVGFGGMTYDPLDGYLVMFGGCYGTFCAGVSNQTWVFYSGQWWPVSSRLEPSARSGTALLWDPMLGAAVLFGGLNGSFALVQDTWSFAAGSWQTIAASSAPSPRSDFGLALDPSGRVPILVGGLGNVSGENDTWAFEVPPSVTLSAPAGPHEAGVPVALTAAVGGGDGSFGLAVTFGDGAGTWVGGSGPDFTVNATYDLAGDFVAGANLTDSAGAIASAPTVAIRVLAAPAVAASASPGAVDLGVPVHFTANASGAGTPPFTYTWWFGDGASAVGSSAAHPYAAPGDAPGVYTVYANLSDAVGARASYLLRVTVAAPPSVSIGLASGAPNTSSPSPFRALLTGGTGPFTYAWSFGDGATSGVPSPNHRYGASGTYTVKLWANDSGGGSAFAEESISVAAGSSPSGPASGSGGSSGAPLWFWAGIGALAAAAVLGTVLLARRGRHR